VQGSPSKATSTIARSSATPRPRPRSSRTRIASSRWSSASSSPRTREPFRPRTCRPTWTRTCSASTGALPRIASLLSSDCSSGFSRRRGAPVRSWVRLSACSPECQTGSTLGQSIRRRSLNDGSVTRWSVIGGHSDRTLGRPFFWRPRIEVPPEQRSR
jgi:hypothetical protein